MPRLTTEIIPLLEQIQEDVGLAWSVAVDDDEEPIPLDVYIGAPRTTISIPYAVVILESLPTQFETMRTVVMDVTIRIVGIFPISDTTSNLDLLKLGKADALISKLEASSIYGTNLASLPIVKDLALPDEDEEDRYRIEVTFGCQSSGSWGA